VRVVADEIRFDEAHRDALGFGLLAAGGVKDSGDEGTEPVVLDVHLGIIRMPLAA